MCRKTVLKHVPCFKACAVKLSSAKCSAKKEKHTQAVTAAPHISKGKGATLVSGTT
jgi:hypothetical protein